MRLQGKRAIVTGGASGFGRGIAEAYAREGARVAILDLNGDGAQAVAIEIGGSAHAADLTRAEQVSQAVQDAVAALGGLDIVVNNAGWTHRNKPILDVTEDEFDKTYAANVKSVFLMVQATLPVLRAQASGGAYVTVGSTAGLRPRPGLSWYNGSKAAANIITQSMAVELAPEKIRCCAIAPVLGETALMEEFMGCPDTPENRAKFISGIPLGRLSKPADIAEAAVWLASDAAEFITGVVLEVDGGRCV